MSKAILITGCSSGFGKETALLLARNGHFVFASMRDADGKNGPAAAELERIARDEQLSLEVLDLDVTSPASIAAAVEAVLGFSGRIDALINNAGYGGFGWSEAFHTAQVRAMFEVNFFGVLELNKAVLPVMRRQGEGLLIHISSVLARLPVQFMSGYNASKFALDGYAESLNMELAPFGIQSLIVQPGLFATAFAQNMFGPADTSRLAEYGDLAELPNQVVAGFGQFLAQMPPSQVVADGMLTLLETPQDQRPLRTVISGEPYGSLTRRLNEAGQQAADELAVIIKQPR